MLVVDSPERGRSSFGDVELVRRRGTARWIRAAGVALVERGFLYRGTGYGAVGAVHAAIALLGFEEGLALGALPEVHAGIIGHFLLCLGPTLGAGDGRKFLDG